jgi:3D-(3,5/4)-trihydroxycyclohexane-1,2-dione acylhydrolase (decyclizing)
MDVDPYEGWTTEGHAWWEVGTPHITESDRVREAHVDWESGRKKQRKGV